MTAHGPERFRIVDEIDDGPAHQRIGVLASYDNDFLHTTEHEQLTHHLGSAVGLLCLGG
jgi:hypothetical protein